MNNKTLKAVVAAFALIASGSVRPNAQASDGGVAQTQPVTQHNCNAGGMTATMSGTCTSNMTISNTISPSGRARGDKVSISGQAKGKLSTTAAGKIQVPQVGQVFEYQYGNITLVIASFNLRGENKNATGLLKKIIATAANDSQYDYANSMIWYGRKLAGSPEVIEIGESLTSAKDLSNTAVNYKPRNNNEFSFTTPSNAGAEEFIVNLNPIKKK